MYHSQWSYAYGSSGLLPWSCLRKETKWVKGKSNYTICELADKLPHEEFIEYLKDNGIYIVNEGGVGLG